MRRARGPLKESRGAGGVGHSKLKIIALSDTHGADTEFAKTFAAIKEEIEQDRKQDERITHILIVAGDVFGANKLLSVCSGGEFDIEAFSKLAALFRANNRFFTPGNHDFLHGWEGLQKLLDAGNFQLLVSNAEFTDDVGLKPVDKIAVTQDGKVIEFRGVMTVETKNSKEGEALLKNIVGTESLQLKEFIGFLVSHLGLYDDMKVDTKAHIIGGHSHHETVISRESGQKVINLGANARMYSSVVLTAGKIESADIVYTQDHKPAPEILELIEKYEETVQQRYQLQPGKISEVVLKVSPDSEMLSGLDILESFDITESHIRINDSCITRLTADAVAKKCGGIALIPAAAFRSNFIPGQDVTMRELMEMYYWDNRLIKVKTTGAELITALARGILCQPNHFHGRGWLLHPSSLLTYSYDLDQDPSNIITGVIYDGKFIDPDETYEVISTNWVIDKCKLFPNAKRVQEFKEPIPFVVEEFAKGTTLSEAFGERISCPQDFQCQQKSAEENPRCGFHENVDLKVNMDRHNKNFMTNKAVGYGVTC